MITGNDKKPETRFEIDYCSCYSEIRNILDAVWKIAADYGRSK